MNEAKEIYKHLGRRLCDYCKREISPYKRDDSKFCSENCRKYFFVRKRQLQNKQKRADYLRALSLLFSIYGDECLVPVFSITRRGLSVKGNYILVKNARKLDNNKFVIDWDLVRGAEEK